MFQNYRDYDILPNGREFVFVVPVNQPKPVLPSRPQIHTVLNSLEELNGRAQSPK